MMREETYLSDEDKEDLDDLIGRGIGKTSRPTSQISVEARVSSALSNHSSQHDIKPDSSIYIYRVFQKKTRPFQNVAISIPFICQRYPLEEL
jgi:hypothetical protein